MSDHTPEHPAPTTPDTDLRRHLVMIRRGWVAAHHEADDQADSQPAARRAA